MIFFFKNYKKFIGVFLSWVVNKNRQLLKPTPDSGRRSGGGIQIVTFPSICNHLENIQLFGITRTRHN